MNAAAGIIVVAFGFFLLAFTAIIFTKPTMAGRFIMGFASSARTHFTEQILRVLVGGSLVIYSAAMWQADAFRLFGWAIVVSSVGLMVFPWQWHQRFGRKILPVLIQYMRLYAIAVFALGAVILYAVFAPMLEGAV